MSFFDTYNNFCKSGENLLLIMQTEEEHLKNTKLNLIDSLFDEKSKLLEANQRFANQLFEPAIWKQLDESQQQNISLLLQSITNNMKKNIKLLDISKLGNKKIVGMFFNKLKNKSIYYTSFGKLLETPYTPSLGVRQLV